MTGILTAKQQVGKIRGGGLVRGHAEALLLAGWLLEPDASRLELLLEKGLLLLLLGEHLLRLLGELRLLDELLMHATAWHNLGLLAGDHLGGLTHRHRLHHVLGTGRRGGRRRRDHLPGLHARLLAVFQGIAVGGAPRIAGGPSGSVPVARVAAAAASAATAAVTIPGVAAAATPAVVGARARPAAPTATVSISFAIPGAPVSTVPSIIPPVVVAAPCVVSTVVRELAGTLIVNAIPSIILLSVLAPVLAT